MACQFKKLSNEGDMGKLNEFLSTRSYLEGYRPSQNDVCVYKACLGQSCNMDCSKFPHVSRWFTHINSFTPQQRSRFPGEVKEEKCDKSKSCETKCDKSKSCDKSGKGKECEKEKEKEKAKEKKEEPASTSEPAEQQEEEEEEQTSSFDALGDEESDDEKQAAFDAIAAAKHAKDAAAGKKAVIAKSTLILDVKPEGSETDMPELEKDVRAIAMEGLVWAGSELVPVAYGVKKLRIISVIVDDLVSTDELREKIEELEGVQSTDIFAFNKV